MAETVLTILGSGAGGAILIKLIEFFFIPKKDIKDFDIKVRDELWDRIKNLEGRLDEQSRVVIEVMKENASLKSEVELLRAENHQYKNNN